MPLSVGTRLGPYEIVAPIGAGGMGEVYRARDARLGRDVALKVLPEIFAKDAERMARFEREAQVLASLNHPNIAALYGLEESNGVRALVMELVEGPTLAERIGTQADSPSRVPSTAVFGASGKSGAIPIDEALPIARQIAEALEYAHEKGVIHRDLKPANIKLTRESQVKVLDFGLAKALEDDPIAGSVPNSPTMSLAATRAGVILGTAGYMSPEQARGKPVDRRADIWSFGVVLFEMLAGRHIYSGETVADTLASVMKDEPKWDALPADTPTAIRKLLHRCLDKDAKRRLQAIGEARVTIEEALSGTAAEETASPSRPVSERPRHRREWIAAAAATLVLGVVAGGFAVSRLRQPAVDQGVLRVQINPPEGGQFSFGIGIGGIALSPDGKTAAFVATANGKTALWLRPLDGTVARMIPETEGASYPFWSPDSKSIAFFTAGKLLRVDLGGGTPLAICDVNSGRGGTWTSDGQITFGSTGSGLRRVSASGGAPSPFTTLDASRGEVVHVWPQALPGGRFLFGFASAKPENTGAYAVSLANPGERVHLLTTDANVLYASGGDGRNYLVWQRGGALVAQEFDAGTLQLIGEARTMADRVAVNGVAGRMNAAVSAGGLLLYSTAGTASQLTWFDRAGKRLGVVGEPGEYSAFRLSPDGRRVAAAREKPGGLDLWLLETDRGVASRFTSTARMNYNPAWSPDGRTIVFGSGPPVNLFRKATAGGSDGQRLTESSNIQYPFDWSRDGRFVLYHELAAGTGRDLWILPVTPDGKPAPGAKARPYLRTQFNEWQGRFSPEADSSSGPRWLAYQSDESARYEVYVDAFPEPRNKVRISIAGGSYPQWSLDGRELFYVSPDLKLMDVSLKRGTDSVEPSPPRELFTLPIIENGFSPYEVGPDGLRFLVRATPEKQAAEPLTLIVNWPALLKKGAAQ